MVTKEVPSTSLLEKNKEIEEADWSFARVRSPSRLGGVLDPSCGVTTRPPPRRRANTYIVGEGGRIE